MPFTYAHPRPAVACDMVVLTVHRQRLEVLLIKRGLPPYAGAWALPGGFVDAGPGGTVDERGTAASEDTIAVAPDLQGESLDDAAARELEEETNLSRDDVYLEQLYTFGAPGRDPRGRVISVAYYALVSAHLLPKVKAGDDAAQADWFPVDELHRDQLAFDHASILDAALQRIRGKIEYEPRIAVGLVPEAFTQAELRRVYEAVNGRPVDRGNFSKRFGRMRSDGLVRQAEGRRELPGAGRPPKLYVFQPAEPDSSGVAGGRSA